MAVAQSDGGQRGSFVMEGLLAIAQLRDMLAAEDSSVVAEKNDHGGTAGPQRAEPHLPAIGIRKYDFF